MGNMLFDAMESFIEFCLASKVTCKAPSMVA